MSLDVDALLRALRENPEQRDELRRALLGDRDVEAILVRLAEAQERTEVRLEALTGRVDALAEAQERTEVRLEALTARVEVLTARVDALAKDVRELAVAQQRTETALNSLVDVVRGMNDRLARLDGETLERKYRERGHAYFQRIARRLRPLEPATLSALVDDAREDGHLSEVDVESLLYADAIFAGRSRDDGAPVHLVVEASVTIDHHDVRRARDRADLLARFVGTPVIAVVAGEFAPQPVAQAAKDAEVWRVTDGDVVPPIAEEV
jgi:hypothetical protein